MVVLGKPRCSPLKMAKLRSIQKFLEISSIPVTMRSQFWGLPGIFFFFLSLIYDFLFLSFLTKVGIVWNIQCRHLLYFV